MSDDSVFQVNEPTVVHETIDDEVVIVVPDSRVYYSLEAAGTVVWHLIARRAGFGHIVSQVVARFETTRAEAEGFIRSLIDELQRHRLIVPCLEPQFAGAPLPATGMRRTFLGSPLRMFTDMTDFDPSRVS